MGRGVRAGVLDQHVLLQVPQPVHTVRVAVVAQAAALPHPLARQSEGLGQRAAQWA